MNMEKLVMKLIDDPMPTQITYDIYNGDPAIMHIEATPVTDEVSELVDLLKEAVYLIEQAKFKFAKGTTNSNADMFLRKKSIKPHRALRFPYDDEDDVIVYMD
jgi:hypothetical protein